jgi:hypothetical protein
MCPLPFFGLLYITCYRIERTPSANHLQIQIIIAEILEVGGERVLRHMKPALEIVTRNQ